MAARYVHLFLVCLVDDVMDVSMSIYWLFTILGIIQRIIYCGMSCLQLFFASTTGPVKDFWMENLSGQYRWYSNAADAYG